MSVYLGRYGVTYYAVPGYLLLTYSSDEEVLVTKGVVLHLDLA